MADRTYLIVGVLFVGAALIIYQQSPKNKPDPNSREEKLKEINQTAQNLLESADLLNDKAKKHGDVILPKSLLINMNQLLAEIDQVEIAAKKLKVPDDAQFFDDLAVLHHDTEKYVREHEEAIQAREPAVRSDSPPPPRPLKAKFKLAQERATYDLPFASNSPTPAQNTVPPNAPSINADSLKAMVRGVILNTIAEEVVRNTHPNVEKVDKSAFKAGGDSNDVNMKESDNKATSAAKIATLAEPPPKKVPTPAPPITKQAVKPIQDAFKQGVAPKNPPETVVDKTAFSSASSPRLDNGDKAPATSEITIPNPNRATMQAQRRAKRKVGASFVASAKRVKASPKKSSKVILDNYKRKLNQARIDVKKAYENLMGSGGTPGGDREQWSRWRKLLHKTAEYSPEGVPPGYFNNTPKESLPPNIQGGRRYGVWKSFMDFQNKLSEKIKEEFKGMESESGRVYRDNV